MEKKVLPFFLLILLMLHIFPIVQSSIEVDKNTVVSRVIDGDTFDTTSGDRIRLADIDAPEKGESGYSSAKTFLTSLVDNKRVYLDIDDVYRTDKYGRLVCVVYVSYNSTHYKNVNKALLVGGYAVVWNFNNEFNPYTWTVYVPKEESPEPEPSPVEPQPSDTNPPTISILSPENKTYTTSSVSLRFTIDESASWLGYRLDGEASETISGNKTIFGLSDGSHTLIVYGRDMANNIGVSNIVHFTIDTQPEPLLSTSELYIIAIVIIVIAGIIVIALSRKKKTSVKPPS